MSSFNNDVLCGGRKALTQQALESRSIFAGQVGHVTGIHLEQHLGARVPHLSGDPLGVFPGGEPQSRGGMAGLIWPSLLEPEVTQQGVPDALGDIAKELNIFMEFSEFEEAKTILLNNPQTITCLSRVAVENELKRKELFEVKLINLKIDRTFYLVYHKNKYHTKLFSLFKAFVHTKIKPI